MHRTIKRFGMEGEAADDAAFPGLREYFEKLIIQDMRATGYVPVIGLGPYWSTLYDIEKDKYRFVLSVHGVYVGRKQAWKVEGITVEGRTLTLPIKSKPSSTN